MDIQSEYGKVWIWKGGSNDNLKDRNENQFDNLSCLKRDSKNWVDWLIDWHFNLNYDLKKQK
jgi:hypothetical protein